jgi:hypothetical protein
LMQVLPKEAVQKAKNACPAEVKEVREGNDYSLRLYFKES